MPNKNKKKGFNWISLVITLIVVLSMGLMVYYLFFRGEPKISEGAFANRIQEDAKSTTDKNYLESIRIDDNLDAIYVTENQNGTVKTYMVSTTREFIRGLYNQDPATRGVNPYSKELVSAFGGNKDGVNVTGTTIKTTSVFMSLLISLVPMILIIGLMWFFLRKSMGGGGAFGKQKTKARRIKTKITFNDIAGNHEVKEEVAELVHYLKNPAKYDAAGARIPKGILLGGPPGVGKTLVAKATAGEAQVPFFFISGSDFVEMFVGLGASRVREMFADARKNAPCILFIDELDAVGRSRGAGVGGGNDEREQTLNQILVEMDGMVENKGVLVMAATNRPDVLDPALLRPGRFDRVITVGLPDVKERQAIIKLHSKGKRLNPDIDFKNLARRTPGFSGAQLENVINEASLLAIREDSPVIEDHHIDEAIDRVMAGPAKKSRTITGKELRATAVHESGHAVVGLKVALAEKVEKITIIPRGQAGGYTLMTPREQKYNYSKKELQAKLMSYLGGRAAEQIYYGEDGITTGVSDDLKKATSIAKDMVTRYGMSRLGPIQYATESGSMFLGRDIQTSKDHSDKIHYEIDIAVKDLIIEAEKEALKIIKANTKLMDVIVDALLEKETLVAEEFEYLSKHYKLPPKKSKVQKNAEKVKFSDLLSQVQGKPLKTKMNRDKPKTKSKSKTKNIDLDSEKKDIKSNSKKATSNKKKSSKNSDKGKK